MQQYDLAAAYVVALTGDINTPMDWRALHDTDKGAPGHARRGPLAQYWQWLCEMNNSGHGCFVAINELDGQGRETINVTAIRTHVVDHDSADAQQQYERACAAHPAPGFAVVSSPGKFHSYWPCERYSDPARYKTVQRKLRQVFNGDPKVIDATRVLRLPGTYHLKSAPHLVTCHALAGYGAPTTVEALEQALAGVIVTEGGDGERKPLGEGDQAPSLEWLTYALTLVDPCDLDRDEWLGITAAVKQAGWSLTDEATLRSMWDAWCERYGGGNDTAENDKMWRSVTSTELGWRTLVKRVPSLAPAVAFGTAHADQPAPATPAIAMPTPPALDCSGEYLTHLECEEYFKGCAFVTTLGQVLGPDATFYNANQFNATFGGKQFIITGDGKKTDEPWKAATRSTLWTIPKVHHIRFVPEVAPGAILTDALGRSGVNMYVPPIIRRIKGDPAPFLNHIAAIIPDEGDRRILFDWMAHIIKYPGFKIPWAPVIQSAEGIGKGVIKDVMTYAVGLPYVHYPNAQELAESGGKFNGWMRNKVFILADEIKVDEKRHMVEVLKPLVSEKLIEVQSKGVDQKMEDNPACWAFFSNYKDAVPVNRNGRRYAIFYSPLQTEAMLLARGMNDDYMKELFSWLHADGCAIVADWLHSYQIERGSIPMRAPKTTSWEEAVKISVSPIERVISEAVADGVPGFRGGWISSLAVVNRCKALGAVRGTIAPQTITALLDGMGYLEVGRCDRPWFVEDREQRATLYGKSQAMDVTRYGFDQGFE